MIDPERKEKSCPICDKICQREDFYEHASMKDNMASMCKECQALYTSVRYYFKMSEEKRKEKRDKMELVTLYLDCIDAGMSIKDTIRKSKGL